LRIFETQKHILAVVIAVCVVYLCAGQVPHIAHNRRTRHGYG